MDFKIEDAIPIPERPVNPATYRRITERHGDGSGRFTTAFRNPDIPTTALTPKQLSFATEVAKGTPATEAMKTAGYTPEAKQCNRLTKNPVIVRAVNYLQKRNEELLDVTRKQVMDGFLEAIEQARVQADPSVQIAGWREIGKMCGYYAPEVKRFELATEHSRRAINHLENLSDEDLMQLIEKDRATIEGEATEVLEATQIEADKDYELMMRHTKA